ncbi:MAG: cobalamin-dependent protein [Acidobacteria bacterium]|nr:cobalamin-dependent protein [Acidobacteriota bacterium]MBU4495126.1 cobalamin-dependent protein [Acidobacteriota bacterium]
MQMDKLLDDIKNNLIAGRVDRQDEGPDGTMEGQPGMRELVQEAIEMGVPPSTIMAQCLNPGMEEVGRLYENGEYLTPDMLAAAESVNTAMTLLEPLLLENNITNNGKFVMATVEGDLHDIGKNIVVTLLRGSGYDIQDLGTSVQADQIVSAIKESQANFLGLSALLTSTMGKMKEVIDKLKEENLREKVKVFIGGAPLTEEYARKIGADFFCEDAFDALNKLNSLKKKK